MPFSDGSGVEGEVQGLLEKLEVCDVNRESLSAMTKVPPIGSALLCRLDLEVAVSSGIRERVVVEVETAGWENKLWTVFGDSYFRIVLSNLVTEI